MSEFFDYFIKTKPQIFTENKYVLNEVSKSILKKGGEYWPFP